MACDIKEHLGCNKPARCPPASCFKLDLNGKRHVCAPQMLGHRNLSIDSRTRQITHMCLEPLCLGPPQRQAGRWLSITPGNHIITHVRHVPYCDETCQAVPSRLPSPAVEEFVIVKGDVELNVKVEGCLCDLTGVVFHKAPFFSPPPPYPTIPM